MKWINFLHLYQPPTQSKEILDGVVAESYAKIISLLEEFPNLRLTMNISGSLLELFECYGHEGLIAAFSKLAHAGRIELVGSAMYHPILPLIPETEARAQIELHDSILKKHFGSAYRPRGFYLPEMAYSSDVGRIIADMGFEWIILDEIHAGKEKIDPTMRYRVNDLGDNLTLGVIFRNHFVSKTFPPEFILEHSELLAEPYLITAHDGELYGHWHKDDKGFYKKAFTNPHITLITASEYRDELTKEKEIAVMTASWESTTDELAAGIPFALWRDPQNTIHADLWKLAQKSADIIRAHSYDSKSKAAAHRLHRGMASCAWWWASERRLGPFSPVTWNPTEIEKGATELLSAVRTLQHLDPDARLEIEKMFGDLRYNIWNAHWKKRHDS